MYWVLNVSAGSVDDGLRLKGDVVGVLLEGHAIGGAVKQARQLKGCGRLARTIRTCDNAECGFSCSHIATLRFHSFISSATVWSLLRFSASAFAFDSRAA